MKKPKEQGILTVVEDSFVLESAEECRRRLGLDDFSMTLKAVKKNPEAQNWIKEHTEVWY